MRFNLFHLMPWPHLPADFDERYSSASVTLPNAVFDPERGPQLYDDYVTQLEYAEALGFDAVCVNEHHQSAYGLMPSPNIIAAMLARRTERIQIAVLGNAIAIRDHPLRVAEEIAMLDNVSRGRVVSGFVRGIGFEYYVQSINPTLSRDRFREAHDLIVKAWTSRDVFEWHSPNYHFRYVNVWPRPVQEPHPPIWVPGTGSRETMRWVAERRYTYLSVYAPARVVKSWFDGFRAAAADVGYEPHPDQIGLLLPIYVGETDAAARAEARQHLEWLYHRALKITNELYFPPGYLSLGSLRGMLRAGVKPFAQTSFEELLEERYVIVGSPSTVVDQLDALRTDLGFGNLCALLHFGDMPHQRALQNMELFASEVMPHFRTEQSGTLAPADVDGEIAVGR
jgi:alkanesulfonate monooxygenase SsuD/methylene tetrahydromethanopterin reductase-like flavin-dependent oxidoreductase (luciferase family)